MDASNRETQRRVEATLDRLRPGLLRDGGNVELISVTADGTVKVEMQGRCATCPAQSATVRHALEPALKQVLPDLVAVVPVPGDPTPVAI